MLGVSPIAIVVCLINVLIRMQLQSPEVTRVNFHLRHIKTYHGLYVIHCVSVHRLGEVAEENPDRKN